jgi:hypothetical protein
VLRFVTTADTEILATAAAVRRLPDDFPGCRAGVGGAGAAGREHGHDERVDVAVEEGERGDVPGGVTAQGVAPHGDRVGPGLR